jgi:hypothetical protein
MGKMKDVFIDLRNQEDDNQMSPPPDELSFTTNKSMWIINGYRVWANSYIEAVEHAKIISKL